MTEQNYGSDTECLCCSITEGGVADREDQSNTEFCCSITGSSLKGVIDQQRRSNRTRCIITNLTWRTNECPTRNVEVILNPLVVLPASRREEISGTQGRWKYYRTHF